METEEKEVMRADRQVQKQAEKLPSHISASSF